MSTIRCVYSQPKKRGPRSAQSLIVNDSCHTPEDEILSPRDTQATLSTHVHAHLDPEPSPGQSLPDAHLHVSYAYDPLTDQETNNLAIQEPSHLSIASTDFAIDAHVINQNSLTIELVTLRQVVRQLDSDEPIEQIMSQCIDAFITYLFPVVPLIHEDSMRASVVVFHDLVSGLGEAHRPQVRQADPGTDSYSFGTEIVKSMAFLTALCAEVGWMLPSNLCPYHSSLASAFLRTSQKCLDLCREDDLRQPDASSIIIRYFHCNCMHAAGQTRLSWMLLGEALRIAQAMRLYDEAAYLGLDQNEARLCRHVFWQLYTSDKSSAFLNNNFFTMHQFMFGESMTVQEPGAADSALLSSGTYSEQELINGFNLCQRLFYHASELVFHIRYASKQVNERSNLDSYLSSYQRASIIKSYIRLITLLDDAPECLRGFSRTDRTRPNTLCQEPEPRSIDVQVANLLVTSVYLRMLITQRCSEGGFQVLLGLPEDQLLMDLHRSETARHMVRVMKEAPFEALRINGEPLVCIPRAIF